MVGNWLYQFFREDFTWALEDGHAYGLPAADSCLSLRVASHLSAWKHQVRANWSELRYVSRARRLMQLAEREPKSLRVALLSANFDASRTWSQVGSAHCEGRDRETLLQRFFGKGLRHIDCDYDYDYDFVGIESNIYTFLIE